MPTEFDDSNHYGFFMTGTTLTSSTGKFLRQSELTLAALRSAGLLDNMEDGTTAPNTDKLWLDKNTDPAVLKEWDSIGSTWEPVTFERMFERAAATVLTVTGGTANAIVCSEPSVFIANRLYSISPTAANTGPTTIQVTGVGTFDVTYLGGGALAANELYTGRPSVLMFRNGRFELITGYAAQVAAESAAASIVDKKFSSLALAQAATISSIAKEIEISFRTPSYAVPHTLVGGGKYRRASLADIVAAGYPASAYFRSTDRFMPDGTTDATNGGYWLLNETVVNWAMFGGFWNSYADRATNGTAFTDMIAYCCLTGAEGDLGAGNLFVNVPAGGFVLTEGIRLFGRGKGYWHPSPISNGNSATKTPAPTQLIPCNTPGRTLNYLGVSSMEACGAMRTNPSARAADYNDTEYRLYSFMTISGTPRDVSAFFLVQADSVTLEHFRMVPYWGGTDGLDGYNDAASVGWSTAAVDFGIWVDARASQKYENVAIVGHWRAGGMHLAQLRLDPTSTIVAPYASSFTDCVFQGFVGMMVRGSDKWRVTAIDAVNGLWFEMPYAADHPFISSVFPYIRRNSASYTTVAIPTVTSVDTTTTPGSIRVNVASAHSLAIGHYIVPMGINGGNSHLVFTNCDFYGIVHPSGKMAHDKTLTNAYNFPSSSVQLSGFRATEIDFINCREQGIEEVGVHIHDYAKLRFEEWKTEGSTNTGIGGGARKRAFISSPAEASNTSVPAGEAAGNTYQIYLDSITLGAEDRHDLRPTVPTTGTPFTGGGDNGFFEFNTGAVGQYHGSPLTIGPYLRPSPGGTAGLKRAGYPSAINAILVNDATGHVEMHLPVDYIGESAITGVTGTGVSSVTLLGNREALFTLTTGNTARVAITAAGSGAGIMQLVTNSFLTSRQGGIVAFDVSGSTGTSIIAGSNLTITPGTANKINVTAGSGYIDIENNTGATIVFKPSLNYL